MHDNDIAEQFEKHLNSPKQTWLLGAGISLAGNIPLMYPLTEQTLKKASTHYFLNDQEALNVINFICEDCPEHSHIENYLTHLGDLISISERSRTGTVKIYEETVKKEKLRSIHETLLSIIADIIRWGYCPPIKDKDGNETEPEKTGSFGNSIVRVQAHKEFISAIFKSGRAGLDFIRSPVEFYTTNYDTLLEDALSLNCVMYDDGFAGGAVAFWSPQSFESRTDAKAVVTKLHGSIDWYRTRSGVSEMFRVRHGDSYPGSQGSVMIYPQATKYINTQRDPFSELFQKFRYRLQVKDDHSILVCGYSFGDEHINDEIEAAMSVSGNNTTLVAFCNEGKAGLPETIERWRKSEWQDRLFVASARGLYQGGVGPVFTRSEGERDWWTFDGVTKLLSQGLPKDIQEALL